MKRHDGRCTQLIPLSGPPFYHLEGKVPRCRWRAYAPESARRNAPRRFNVTRRLFPVELIQQTNTEQESSRRLLGGNLDMACEICGLANDEDSQ